uniref:NAD-dependent epimerase/dehydratase domain-containing protein n=1 Tax=Eucampia antarctica TaxID=49252 RepID=A0A7S2SE39_9STRA|mmetsp:Transcript_6908/g.6543  ORF Transcript_6908/g.6543 Transcript_6908/m.6543 type:complete len:312 (+) Transcript_6908:109-1044(+)|eukprot:CAMPEP_0197831128 /NCGR_PEP_ID=MMETSP1437-20131217/7718_1 /TAXON_ID=49252 ORGANISM="Eucampia antarctica, Strain CCMP1452" /NCGR_SAMPLE_ID=MMETSP1437 /ASSEMBLY_ACC=CAM_ASM_001096 /LENGTH=311 /DNA_ID=CAMNT_0043433905 /DNA_START=93 /DNA_END=1028 /DNA_ORIENTATION=+
MVRHTLLQILFVFANVGTSIIAESFSVSSSSDNGSIAVFGCGVLGTSLCKQLLSSSDFDSRLVTGITKTSNRHDGIREQIPSERFSVKTYDEIAGTKFRDVIFCAPPSGSEDYPGAIKDAIQNLWDGPSGGGHFVFTSSGGIYGIGNDGAMVTEDTPVADPEKNPRVAKLVEAERICKEGGGCVLRLAGLYNLERGAHNYWLESGNDVKGREDGFINLLHYDDAAGACVAALKVDPSSVAGKAFLISDGNPTSRKGICESARKAAMYSEKAMPKFLGESTDPKGKIYDGTKSNAALKWNPRYSSFDKFMSI